MHSSLTGGAAPNFFSIFLAILHSRLHLFLVNYVISSLQFRLKIQCFFNSGSQIVETGESCRRLKRLGEWRIQGDEVVMMLLLCVQWREYNDYISETGCRFVWFCFGTCRLAHILDMKHGLYQVKKNGEDNMKGLDVV
ncbi:unnamed protein product [Vicia faba]|uniref:Uncharacterized protein n=1 Tax=Vicia faba TaxID=3906 RepID=A0AAV1BDG1_VICFA|nr:unnamed protein product [Vicia faba]